MHPQLRTIALITGVATAAITAVILSSPATAATVQTCDNSPTGVTITRTVSDDPTTGYRTRALRKRVVGELRIIAAERRPAVRIPDSPAVDRLYVRKLAALYTVVQRVRKAAPKQASDDGVTKLESVLNKVDVGLGNIKSELSCTALVFGGSLNPKSAPYMTFVSDAKAALDTAESTQSEDIDVAADRALLATLPDVLAAFNTHLSAAVKALAKVSIFDTDAVNTAKNVAFMASGSDAEAMALGNVISSLADDTSTARPLNWH